MSWGDHKLVVEPPLGFCGVLARRARVHRLPQVAEAVTKEVAAVCQAAKLAKFEIPTKVILIEELWTPENDMLTAVQKLKRREIVAKYKADIDRVYV